MVQISQVGTAGQSLGPSGAIVSRFHNPLEKTHSWASAMTPGDWSVVRALNGSDSDNLNFHVDGLANPHGPLTIRRGLNPSTNSSDHE